MVFYHITDAGRYIRSFSQRKIGITSGCFDIIHPLHVDYLNKCKRYCEHLFVAVDTDANTYRNKNKWPLFSENDRAYMIDNLQCTAGVILIDSLDDFRYLVERFAETDNEIVMFKNSNTIHGAPAIEIEKVELIIVPDVSRFCSTTQITDQLKS